MSSFLQPLPIFGFMVLAISIIFSLNRVDNRDQVKAQLHSASTNTSTHLEDASSLPLGLPREDSALLSNVLRLILAGKGDEAAGYIVEMDPQEVLSLITKLEKALAGEAIEKQADILVQLSREIGMQNPQNALLLSGAFFSLPDMPTVERSIFLSWFEEDLQTALDFLSGDIVTASNHQIAIASSIFQNENREQLPDFLEWISKHSNASSDDQENPERQNVFASAANKLVTFASDDTLQQVVDFLTEHIDNPSAGANLANLLESTIMDNPETADAWLEWLSKLSLEDVETRTMLTAATVGGLSTNAPDKVVELLSSAEFIDSHYTPLSPDETADQRDENQRAFFDRLLWQYVQNTIQYNPEDTLEIAAAFHDPKRRKSTETWARNIIENIPPDTLNIETGQ